MVNPDRTLGRPLNEREAFTNLIEALRVAESSCRQIAYVRSQPHWFLVQNQLASVRDIVTTMMNGRMAPLQHKFLS